MADELKQEQDASRAATRAAEEDEHKAQLEAVRKETERKVSGSACTACFAAAARSICI